MIAEVILHLGRYFLVVRGVYLAMQGDVCRDPALPGRVWTKATLDEAAAFINAGLWASAQARFASGEELPYAE